MPALLKKPRTSRRSLGNRDGPRILEGHVEKLQLVDRFVQVRFGKLPGDYLILYIPRECKVHRNGDPLPLRDVQFCDSVSVSYHRHYRFDVQLAQEIEVC